MYDVQLAYMVVAHSQRDPGEYLLELQHLTAHPSAPLRHHAMDMHLGRFDKAVQHLVVAGPEHFPKALQLARAKVSSFPNMLWPSLQNAIHSSREEKEVKSVAESAMLCSHLHSQLLFGMAQWHVPCAQQSWAILPLQCTQTAASPSLKQLCC